MNKKLILICICVLALTCAGLQAVAQDKPDQPAPQTAPSEPAPQTAPGSQTNPQPSTDASQTGVSDADAAAKVDARMQQLTTELGLSAEQQAQIKPILIEGAKRLQAVKNDNTRSVDAKQSKMDDIHDNTRGQLRQFLTPDQGKKLDALKADDVI
jgi:hypothetical protein